MPTIKIEIKNLAQIQAGFHRSPVIMTRNLSKAIQRSALIIGRQSRINTPVRTGRLRGSTYERFQSGLRAEIGTNTIYDRFVHEGTRFMKARPYLKDAVESTAATVQQQFTTAVQDTLDEIAKAAS